MNPHLQVFFKPEPGLKFDVLIYSIGGDLPLALSLAAEVKQVVVDYSNHYLVEKSWFKSVFRINFSLYERDTNCLFPPTGPLSRR